MSLGKMACAIIALVAAGCAVGSKDVFVKHGSGFNKNAPAILSAEHGDLQDVKTILQKKLRTRGFNIVQDMSENPKFIVRFRYMSLMGHGIRDFEASIFPTGEREPVALLRFRGGGILDTNVMVDELIAQLEGQLE